VRSDRGNPKWLQKNLPHYDFGDHKSHVKLTTTSNRARAIRSGEVRSDRGNPKWLQENLPHYDFGDHKSHVKLTTTWNRACPVRNRGSEKWQGKPEMVAEKPAPFWLWWPQIPRKANHDFKPGLPHKKQGKWEVTGEPRNGCRKTCPIMTLVTTNPT